MKLAQKVLNFLEGGLPPLPFREAPFYEGKIAAARYFCREVLPNVTLARKLVEKSSIELMDLSEEVF